jgi:hypothetical protein
MNRVEVLFGVLEEAAWARSTEYRVCFIEPSVKKQDELVSLSESFRFISPVGESGTFFAE